MAKGVPSAKWRRASIKMRRFHFDEGTRPSHSREKYLHFAELRLNNVDILRASDMPSLIKENLPAT
jgi:hypothetical protein